MKKCLVVVVMGLALGSAAFAQLAYVNVVGTAPIAIGSATNGTSQSSATIISAGALIEVDAEFPGMPVAPHFAFGYGIPVSLSATINGSPSSASIDDYLTGSNVIIMMGAAYAHKFDKLRASASLAGGTIWTTLPSKEVRSVTGHMISGPLLNWLNFGLLAGVSLDYSLSETLSLYGTFKFAYTFIKSSSSDADSIMILIPGLGVKLLLASTPQ